MVRVGKGNERCDCDAVAECHLAENDGGRDLGVCGGWIGWCAGGSVDDRGSRVLEHSRHLGKVGLRC